MARGKRLGIVRDVDTPARPRRRAATKMTRWRGGNLHVFAMLDADAKTATDTMVPNRLADD